MYDPKNYWLGFTSGCLAIFGAILLCNLVSWIDKCIIKEPIINTTGVYRNEQSLYVGRDDFTSALLECDKLNDYAQNFITNGVSKISHYTLSRIEMILKFDDANIYEYKLNLFQVNKNSKESN